MFHCPKSIFTLLKEAVLEKTKKRKRRSDSKVITKEAQVLRFMRKSKNLSMRSAALIINKSDTLISHTEHGRIDLHNKLIERLVTAYGYTMEDFNLFMVSDETLFVDYKEDLINFIHKMDDAQIMKAFNLLKAMIK
jgi:transcriptional regulator with XRE-family HTH domain|tara:strand:+ start:247 stop:654 length:408 start_codon:yes stop_codon:yes gene_type:complete